MLPPTSARRSVAHHAAGVIDAVSVLLSRRSGTSPPGGDLLDLSLLECACLITTMHPATYLSICGRPMREARTLNFPGIERTADGWVGFMVVTGQQWLDFCVLLERES